MIPQKQTVYLAENGHQEKYVISDNDNDGCFNGVIEKEGYFFTPEQFNNFVANVVEETLKTAANKAECCKDASVDLGWTIIDAYVEKESIINTFEETFKKFKV